MENPFEIILQKLENIENEDRNKQAPGIEDSSAEAQAINKACTKDTLAASCGNKKVGTGLLNCLDSYKYSQTKFVLSEGCLTAWKKFKDIRKEL